MTSIILSIFWAYILFSPPTNLNIPPYVPEPCHPIKNPCIDVEVRDVESNKLIYKGSASSTVLYLPKPAKSKYTVRGLDKTFNEAEIRQYLSVDKASR